MTKSEMKKWIVAIGIVVVCSGGYMLYSSPTNNEPANQIKATNEKNLKEETKNHELAFGITEAMKDENVTIQGHITNISSGKGHVFPVLKDPQNGKTIKTVIFAAKKEKDKEEVKERQDFVEKRRKDGKLVTIEGKVSVYNGELEVIINKAY